MTRPRGLMMNPTLKKRSLRSGWRAFACAMTNALYSFAILPRASVSSPGMSIAHSRANVAWSRSRTSSLKACSAPSGKAISLTGMSRLESHDAAFTRCERCSRLILMSLRLRMPRTVGMRPTAVYGLIMPTLLARSPSVTGDARDLRDAVVAKLDGHLVLLAVVRRPVDHRAPARRGDALVLLVGTAEPRHHLVVARADGNQRDQTLARGEGRAVRRRGRGPEPPPAPAPLDTAAQVRAEHEHAREVREEQDQRGDHHRPPVYAAAEVVELDSQALGGDVLRREERERHHLAAGSHAALAPHRRGRRDLLDLKVIGVAEVRDEQRVLAGQVHDPVAPLVVEREEPERRGPQIAEAGGDDLPAAPEELVEPRCRLRRDEPAEREHERHDRELIGKPRRPRNLDVRHGAGLAAGAGVGDVRGEHVERLAERDGAHLQPVAASQEQPTASDDGEAPALDLPDQLGLRRAGRGALRDLGRPQEVQVLVDVGPAPPRLEREAPGEVDGHRPVPRAHVGDHEEGPDEELRVRPG